VPPGQSAAQPFEFGKLDSMMGLDVPVGVAMEGLVKGFDAERSRRTI
jgi:hypothetical protein